MKPLISIIMSVYNGEKFLASAIDSIIQQSITNFEFIIINDGSTDQSLNLLKDYALRDTRIRLISRENRGLIASLNEAIEISQGEWIARMDADDISRPDRLEKQLAWLNKTGADLCGGQIQLLGTKPARIWKYYTSNEAIRIKMLFGSPFAHPTIMLRTTVAKANLYNKDAHYVEDYELWARLCMQGIEMTNTPDVVLEYRIHAEQTTAIKQKQQRVNMLNIFRDYSNSFIKNVLSDSTGYLLVADKQLDINNQSFDHAMKFMHGLEQEYGNPEKVVSDNVFIFLTRCGELGPLKVMPQARAFSLGFMQKLILLFLSLTHTSPRSKLYQLMYRLR